MAKLTIEISFKKIIEICPLGLLYFSIHRVKIGKKWGRYLIIIADNLDMKMCWL